jgi:N-acetylglucosamine-6-phosphate deacetylase
MRLRARHYRTGQPLDITCVNGMIDSVAAAGAVVPDVEAGWVAPAFCDVQINGCDGYSFNSASLTVDHVRHVVTVCRRHGIAQLCPTLVTGPFDALAHGLATVHQACDSDADLARAIPGIHVEGPYISPEDGPRGAHPRDHVRPPSWDEWRRLQDAAAGRIRVVTLAPEVPGAIAFIEKLAAAGVVVALGHTAASAECIQAAITAGARLSTHLGNGAHAVLPRHPNYIWEQLAADSLWASLIADGHHLPLSVLKCMLRVKTPARLILTCDASPLAGLPPGRYRDWEQDFEIRADGKIVVAGTQYLAGSGAFTDQCLATVLSLGELPVADAVAMATTRPRELLGLPARDVLPGEPAELILFDWHPGDGHNMSPDPCPVATRPVAEAWDTNEGYNGTGPRLTIRQTCS